MMRQKFLTRDGHEALEAKKIEQEHKELTHTWRKLSRREIAQQYPPERVEQLLSRASSKGLSNLEMERALRGYPL